MKMFLAPSNLSTLSFVLRVKPQRKAAREMHGRAANRGPAQVHVPASLGVWLRYQVESIPRVAANSGHFSARCAAASLRLKLNAALRANLIDAATARELSEMLDQVGRAEETA